MSAAGQSFRKECRYARNAEKNKRKKLPGYILLIPQKEEEEEEKMPFVLSLFTAIFKFIVISLAWMALEKHFYGEVQPRIVDDIIGLILFFYILKGEIL